MKKETKNDSPRSKKSVVEQKNDLLGVNADVQGLASTAVVDTQRSNTKNVKLKPKNEFFDENANPAEFIELRAIFDSICELLDKEPVEIHEMNYGRKDFRNVFTRGFESGAWAWEPITKRMVDEQIDRLGEVIMGPLYTCEEYPWPEKDGFPMAPLIQLDLKKSSDIGSIQLGDGLLQVWMPHKAISTPLFIRVIPKAGVNLKKLMPIVDIPKEMEPLQSRGEEWSDELEEFVPSQAIQIIDYSPRRFTFQILHPIQANYSIEQLTKNSETALLIKEFDKKIKPFLKKGKKGFNAATCHLFGTFSPIHHVDKDCPAPLFCFESDEFDLSWGQAGNAQLFYKINDGGEVSFSFDWNDT